MNEADLEAMRRLCAEIVERRRRADVALALQRRFGAPQAPERVEDVVKLPTDEAALARDDPKPRLKRRFFVFRRKRQGDPLAPRVKR